MEVLMTFSRQSVAIIKFYTICELKVFLCKTHFAGKEQEKNGLVLILLHPFFMVTVKKLTLFKAKLAASSRNGDKPDNFWGNQMIFLWKNVLRKRNVKFNVRYHFGDIIWILNDII